MKIIHMYKFFSLNVPLISIFICYISIRVNQYFDLNDFIIHLFAELKII